jgi:GNAT superfamily N-acetyltransferase
MRIMPWVADDPTVVKACYEVSQAVQRADDPLGPPMSERVLRAVLKSPAEPAQTWFVPGDTPGTAYGLYHLRLPLKENRQRGGLYIEVHPDYRRRGIGSALLRHAAEQAAADGRSVLATDTIMGSPGEAFARHVGAEPGIAEARRVQVLAKLPASQVAALRSDAERAAAGYTLVTWTDRTPEEYLPGAAAVFNAMSDAPHNPGHESRVWDAERVRENLDNQRELFGSRGYFVAALQAGTGEMAAISQVEVDPENPGWGTQQITAVARPHRGHRLGLLVKTAMLEWLASAEPQLERIVTWNAAANDHMIAINQTLGYELLDPQSRSYELPVASVLGAGAGAGPGADPGAGAGAG